jgi:N-acetylglucosamine repressor
MPKMKSVDHAMMREMNLALVLNILRQHAPISRARLSSITGLNKATISSLVRELLKRELVREIGVDTSGADIGRPAINIELNPDAGYIVGAEIGADFVSVIVTNFAAKILVRRHENTFHLRSQSAILKHLVGLLEDSCQEASNEHRPVFGIGLGVPGLVNQTSGVLLFAPNLGWSDVSLRELLEHQVQAPLFLDNEANLAALGEAYFGAGQGGDCVLYVSAGVGLGGGIVLNGQVLLGSAGFAGEVGHMTLEPDGHLCNCGNRGCWETLVSQRAIIRSVKELIQQGKTSALAASVENDLERLTVPAIVQAAQCGDAVALQAFRQAGYWLGIGLANLINTLNPDRVVIGGILSLGHQYILPSAQEELNKRALRWPRLNCEIVSAVHGTDACMMGGIATVYRKILSQPIGWSVDGI